MFFKNHKNTRIRLAVLLLLVGLEFPAAAGVFEISGSFSYSQSNYGNGNYSWSRRIGASIGYYFFALSELEFGFQDVFYRTSVNNYENTTFHDQIYSLNWVQTLAPKNSIIQPYLKFGIGQLNREAQGSYAGGGSPPAIYDSLTQIAGAGVRFHIVRNLSLKVEGATYLTQGGISTWQDNFSINGGLSIYF